MHRFSLVPTLFIILLACPSVSSACKPSSTTLADASKLKDSVTNHLCRHSLDVANSSGQDTARIIIMDITALEESLRWFYAYSTMASPSNRFVRNKASRASRSAAAWCTETFLTDALGSLEILAMQLGNVRGPTRQATGPDSDLTAVQKQLSRSLDKYRKQCRSAKAVPFDKSMTPAVFLDFPELSSSRLLAGGSAGKSCGTDDKREMLAVQIRVMRNVLPFACSAFLLMDDMVKAGPLSPKEAQAAADFITRADRFADAFQLADRSALEFIRSEPGHADSEVARKFSSALQRLQQAYSARMREAAAAVGMTPQSQ